MLVLVIVVVLVTVAYCSYSIMGTGWSHEDGRGHSCFFGSHLQSLERCRLAKFLNVLLTSYIFGKRWVWKIAIFYLDK